MVPGLFDFDRPVDKLTGADRRAKTSVAQPCCIKVSAGHSPDGFVDIGDPVGTPAAEEVFRNFNFKMPKYTFG